MNRRDFLRAAGAVSASLAFPSTRRLFAEGVPTGEGWRTFEVTTRVEVLKPSGQTLIWVPAALVGETAYQKTLSNDFATDGGTASLVEGPSKLDKLGIVAAKFPEGAKPVLTVTSKVQTRNVAVDPGKSGTPKASKAELEHFLEPSKYVPTDGIVAATSALATKGAKTDAEKAKAIYEWIVDNTYRNPKTKGCGIGDIRFMLESKDLGGKCADLNALYVGLARAAGIPARDVYGIRVAKSELGYKSLGASSEKVTKSQHCRAEVHLAGSGWTPVDPADVRKVVLEEPPGNRPVDDEMVVKARKRLWGSWEMNWMAFNFGHDVALPGSKGAPVPFFMYPQAETAEGRLDPLDPDNFKYEIVSRELTG
jgi:transglutaminase-like putative cysteine protease